MTRLVSLHDRTRLAAFLRKDAGLHLYALGDLDDFFWPATLWYGLEVDGELRQVLLGYLADSFLVMHALTSGPLAEMQVLLTRVRPLLPPRVYAHLTPGLGAVLAAHYRFEEHGAHHKMLLTAPEQLGAHGEAEVERLALADLDELRALYGASYPDNWFDPRMLETGQYYGLREGRALVSVAGVHVYAPEQGIAALGNIVTHPAARGHGYATRVTAALCRQLLQTVPQIGLNVRADNAAALACYRRLGFTRSADYEEVALTLRGAP